MKGFALIINAIVFFASIVGIVVNLCLSQFGTAWLWIIPLVFSYINCEAITEDE